MSLHPAGGGRVHVVIADRQPGRGGRAPPSASTAARRRGPRALRRDGTPGTPGLVSACTSTTIGRCPSIVGTTAEPGDAGAAVGEEQRRRVGHADQPGAGHLEQAEFVGGPEPMLGRPQQPQGVVAIALELQHGVDDVLEHARPGEAAVLGDVADQHDRDVALLGHVDEPLCAARAPGRRCPAANRASGRTRSGSSRSRRARRTVSIDRVEDVRQRRLGVQPEIGPHGVETFGAQPNLLGALLSADVQRRARSRRRAVAAAACSCRCPVRRRAA